jgi:hypothetical protein
MAQPGTSRLVGFQLRAFANYAKMIDWIGFTARCGSSGLHLHGERETSSKVVDSSTN